MNNKLPELIKSMPTTEDFMRKAPKGTFPEELLAKFDDIHSYFIQDDNYLIQFTQTDKEFSFTEHMHGEQWSYVFSGSATFTFSDKTEVYSQGKWYNIPANTKHTATLSKGYTDVTVLSMKK